MTQIWIFIKNNILLLFFLIASVYILQSIIFADQLKYGFRDVDWQVLYYYKIFGKLSFNHLVSAYKLMGAYTYELYYVGLLEKILGLDFTLLHQASQLFKIITAISFYFIMAKIFKRKLLAFLSSIIYTISYTHAGPLFMLSTGGYFFATIFMCMFLLAYYYSLFSKNLLKYIFASILLMVTLVLNTERMYPLISLVILVEVAFVLLNKLKKELIIDSLIRTSLIFLPIIVFAIFYLTWFKNSIVSTGFAPGHFFIMIENRVDSVISGNLQLLLYPFASLGSIFLHGEFWKYFGQVNIQNFSSYTLSLIFGPLLKLSLGTFLLFFLIFKKPLRLTLVVLFPLFIFGLIIYAVFINWQKISPQFRIHFDPNLITLPALFGFYILLLNVVFFVKLIKEGDKRLIPPLLGFLFTALFIFLTWIASDVQLIFMGTQRYLSIPAFGTSLFISALFLIIFERLQVIRFTKPFAWVIFLFLIPLIFVNYQVANNFFNYELNYAGMKGEDQIRMKDSFRSLVPVIDKKERSLFYFDETADRDNGYFDESTIMAGFEYWIRVNADGTLNNFPEPGMMRTNVQCPEHTHVSCMEMLKEGLTLNNGEEGILYKDPIRGQTEPRFYKLSNFYAFRFINKQLIDIRKDVLREVSK